VPAEQLAKPIVARGRRSLASKRKQENERGNEVLHDIFRRVKPYGDLWPSFLSKEDINQLAQSNRELVVRIRRAVLRGVRREVREEAMLNADSTARMISKVRAPTTRRASAPTSS
jgi:hypothetical protein